MIEKLSKYSIVFLIAPIISSCFFISERENKPIIVEHTKVIKSQILKCPKPNRPIFNKLDENKPLTSAYNLNILLNNIILLNEYCKQLELTVQCYEEQIQEDTDNGKQGKGNSKGNEKRNITTKEVGK